MTPEELKSVEEHLSLADGYLKFVFDPRPKSVFATVILSCRQLLTELAASQERVRELEARIEGGA